MEASLRNRVLFERSLRMENKLVRGNIIHGAITAYVEIPFARE
jgi:hypothetical protein